MVGRKPQCVAWFCGWSGELPYSAMPGRTQSAITLELEPTPAVQAMKTLDTMLLAPMRLAAGLFPSLSALGTGDFVAGGFDIPFDLLAANATETLGYVLAFFIAGAFCLKAREVAS